MTLFLALLVAAAGSAALFLDHAAIGVPLIFAGAVGTRAAVAARDDAHGGKQTD